MRKWLAAFGAFLLLIVAAAGAAWYWLYHPKEQQLAVVTEQSANCAAQVHQLKDAVADLTAIRNELQQTSSELADKIAVREQEMAGLRSTHDALIGELKQEIASKQIEVERVRDKLRVEMVDEILFDSGQAELKPGGIDVLKKVGGVLARVVDRGIEIQGHTDNVPIRGALTRKYATNWELSAARAVNVARFLAEQGGVAPARLSAIGFAEQQPRASNDTDEGRRKNRRIEILLSPLEVRGEKTE